MMSVPFTSNQVVTHLNLVKTTLPKRFSENERRDAYSVLIERPAGGLNPADSLPQTGPVFVTSSPCADAGPPLWQTVGMGTLLIAAGGSALAGCVFVAAYLARFA